MMGVFLGHRAAPVVAEQRFLPPQPYVPSGSYASVDLTRSEDSLQKVAVWAAVDLIASLVSEMPFDVYRGWGPDKKEMPTPPWLQDPAADGHGAEDWLYQLLVSWLITGNGFGIIRDRHARTGLFPTAIELLHPDYMNVWITTDGPKFMYDGTTLPVEDLHHTRAYPSPGYLLGKSPIQMAMSTMKLGIAVTRFGQQWFTDGAHPGGLLTNTESDLNPEQATTAKQRFMAAMRGTREPVVLGRGWQYQQIQIAPEESQFLETYKTNAADCARIFGPGVPAILGYETGGSMTYSNIESQFTHLLVTTLNRWLRSAERVLSGMLPRGQYVRFNRDALLQSTTLTRFQAHEIALRNKWATVNEVREVEDMPPVPWGDAPSGAQSSQDPQPNSGAQSSPDDQSTPSSGGN